MNCRYVAYFDLDGTPDDYEGAYHYLEEDEMLKYYDGLGKEKIKCIDWCLTGSWSYSSGFILVDTYEELTEEEMDSVSSFIRGQNSDGLGEGFEQNFFYTDSYDGEERMCCFDWPDNDYKLYRYGSHFSSYAWKEVDAFAGVWEETNE